LFKLDHSFIYQCVCQEPDLEITLKHTKTDRTKVKWFCPPLLYVSPCVFCASWNGVKAVHVKKYIEAHLKYL